MMDTLTSIPKARWWRIIPPTIIINLIAFMDRMNISFAMAGGMNEELGISLGIAGMAAGIFFIGYILLQIPAGHIAEKGYAKKYILFTIFAWGGISFLTGIVQNSWQLLIMRFLLGVAEGGVYPSILVIIANWFPQKELGRANSLFMLSLPIAAILTNMISGFLVASFGWRSLFFIEGVVSLLLLLVWIPLMAESPEKAKWISKEEKEYLTQRIAMERKERLDNYESHMHPTGSSVKELLSNKYLWIMTFIYLCHNTGQYGYSMWLPTIIKQLTHTGMTMVGFLSTPPFVLALVGIYVFGMWSDKKGNRKLCATTAFFMFGSLLFVSTFFKTEIWIAYICLVLTGLFSKSINSPFWSMAPTLFPPGMAGAARGFINAFGNLGGFVGPTVVGWISAQAGDSMIGLYSLVIVLLIGAGLTRLLPVETSKFSDIDK